MSFLDSHTEGGRTYLQKVFKIVSSHFLQFRAVSYKTPNRIAPKRRYFTKTSVNKFVISYDLARIRLTADPTLQLNLHQSIEECVEGE
jgi:hypothetical protein